MAMLAERAGASGTGRFHAFLLAAVVPLFVGAWLADCAYWSSYQVEWSNFAAWLLAGGLAVGVLALLVGVFALLRGARPLLLLLLQLATWATGLFATLVHARDAWAVMPTGMWLSALAAILAIASAWLAFSTLRAGDVP
jgi:uncharacterized membrane protein